MSLIDELLKDAGEDAGEEPVREAAVCPSCKKATETTPCERCGAKFRFKPVGAVLGEGILDELGLSEADLDDAVDGPSGGGRRDDAPDRRVVGWVRSLRDPNRLGGPVPPERVVEIISGSGFAAGEVDASLRLVEARGSATDDEGDERDELSEGLDGWLDDRLEG